jgi:hypothetical protein
MKKLIYQHQDLLLISLLVLAFALDYFLAIEQWMLIFVVLAIILIGKAVCENVEPEMIALKKMQKAKLEEQEIQSKLIPHEQGLLETHDRKTYGNEPENPVIAQLRNYEELSSAPFSTKTLIEWDTLVDTKYECPIKYSDYNDVTGVTNYGDVPILNILGACTTNNMATGYQEVFEPNTTFRGTLFHYLHGGNLNQASLDYFEDGKRSSGGLPVEIIGDDPKTKSKREWTFVQYGDYFFSSNGHQRTVFAMYHLFQKYGDEAVIKNVKITKYTL